MNRNIYETYKELNSLLPKGFVKLKVLKSSYYNTLNYNNSILMKIEKESNKYNNLINKYNKISLNKIKKKNIILYKGKKEEKKINLNINHKRNNSMNSIKSKNRTLKESFSDYYNIENNKILKNCKSIEDYKLKKNIYLPKIIDRLKYQIPRNKRGNGFFIQGHKFIP